MSHIDLHLHSTCSDGILEPEALVEAARHAGVGTIALCDHDSISGVDRAIEAGRACGIKVLRGVELSVAYKELNDIHLLGYCFNNIAPELSEKLELFSTRRATRNREIVLAVNKKLKQQGLVPLTYKEVEKLAEGVMGRPHIARALIARGYAASMEDSFKRYLIPCDVSKAYWEIEDALSVIRRSGGVAILAHPTSISIDPVFLEKLIKDLANVGLDGIEVLNSMATEHESACLQQLAQRNNLLITAGSDFHGIDNEAAIGKGRGGIRFSSALLPPLLSLAESRKA